MKISWLTIYNLVLGLWIGGMAIFTFIITPAIFKSYRRDLAGEIVGKLFPGYFLYVLVLTTLAFIIFFTVSQGALNPTARLSFALLVLALLLNTYIAFKLHPDAVRVKSQITSFESESPDSPARKKFARLHAASATLNLVIFADGIVLLLLGPTLKK